MIRFWFSILALLFSVSVALAQAVTTPCYVTENIRSGATVQNCAPSVTPQASAELASSLVVKATAGNLSSFQVSADSTLSGAAWWVMIFDATAAPADGAVTPKKCYAVASGVTNLTVQYPIPIQFVNGVVIGVGTTGCFNKTASVHAFISGDVL